MAIFGRWQRGNMMGFSSIMALLPALALAFAPAPAPAPQSNITQQVEPMRVTPQELMAFSQCHGAVDGMAANVAAVITDYPETVPIDVLEMQAELGELAELLETVSKRVSADEQMHFPTYRQTEQAAMRYKDAFAAHREPPQSITTIIAYVDGSLANLDDLCEDPVERLIFRYFPKGYPRQIE